MLKNAICFLLILGLASTLNAEENKNTENKKNEKPVATKSIKDVEFPVEKVVAGEKLVLNGLGLRKAFFTVKVYVGALYLSEKSTEVDAIVKNPKVKKVEMQFLMGVPRNKLTEAWREALYNQCPKDCSNVKEGTAKMNSYMTSVVKGDRFEYTIFPDKVLVSIKGEEKPAIPGKDFAEAMIKIYVGDKAIDSNLAKGLRGLE